MTRDARGLPRRLAVPVRDRLVDVGFGVGWNLARPIPESVTARVLQEVGAQLWRQGGDGVRQLERNLRRAVPDADDDELRSLSRRAMSSYFRYWHEVLRLPSQRPERVVESVVTLNEAALRAAMAGDRGAIVALPHMANWDHAGAWACLTGMPVTTVAERLQPESLFDRFVGYRERLGMEVLPLTASTSSITRLRAALGHGRLVCLVADRDLSRSGVRVELLGEPAALPPGPAALARITGAPLFAATLSYAGPLLRISFSAAVPVRPGAGGVAAGTQEVADHFSAGIRRSPVDWHMLQPVFIADTQHRRASDTDETAAPPTTLKAPR
jgi:phosphatidylinositol dimannoside acyltransferase